MAQTNKVPVSAGAVSSFAHLAGVLAAKADNDTDEEDNKKDREKEEKEAKAKKAEEEEAKKKAAEKDEEDEKKKEEEKASKRAEMPKDENEDKEKDARHAERRRIHAIMTCAGAAHAVDEAERLAFNTDMPSDLAISNLNVKAMELMLKKAQKPAPAAKTDSLRDRMQNEPTPQIGADGGETSTGDAYQDQVRAATAAIIAADAKRRGVKVS
jgi:outer membrane biosynthesis protein TonB